MPEATRAAAELKQKLSVDAKLTPGDGGVFDVKVYGKTVFSLFELGRFPDEGELAKLVEAV